MAHRPALLYLTAMTTDLTSPEGDALLNEAISALLASGRIVETIADQPGCYQVDAGPPLNASAILILAWDQGLMSVEQAET